MEEKKIVYVGMSIDILHHGHINILNEASKFGKVLVGLLSDRAISTGKRVPLLNFEQRKKIVESLKYVSEIVIQDEWDYSKNLVRYKPDYMIHGDEWLSVH